MKYYHRSSHQQFSWHNYKPHFHSKCMCKQSSSLCKREVYHHKRWSWSSRLLQGFLPCIWKFTIWGTKFKARWGVLNTLVMIKTVSFVELSYRLWVYNIKLEAQLSVFNYPLLWHLLCRDSKLTRLLREAMGSLSCRTVMIAHASSAVPFYSETLSTIQLASRIHRMRKKKSKVIFSFIIHWDELFFQDVFCDWVYDIITENHLAVRWILNFNSTADVRSIHQPLLMMKLSLTTTVPTFDVLIKVLCWVLHFLQGQEVHKE